MMKKGTIYLLVLISTLSSALQDVYFKNGGCYSLWEHQSLVQTLPNLTLQESMKECVDGNFTFTSLGNGSFFCHHNPPPISKLRSDNKCSTACDGEDGSEMCGGLNYFSVYKNIEDAGCYGYAYNASIADISGEDISGQELIDINTLINSSSHNTIDGCIDRCLSKNYSYAGVAVGIYCACSTHPPPTNLLKNYNECGESCTGNPLQICGGYKKLSDGSEVQRGNMYLTLQQDEGCFHVEKYRWWLNEKRTISPNNTILECRKNCSEMNYTYAGVTGGRWCACGNNPPSIGHLRPKTECNLRCAGDENSKCGGSDTMQIVNTLQIGGCYRTRSYLEMPLKKSMNSKVKPLTFHLHYHLHNSMNNTVEVCIEICKKAKHFFAGVTNGSYCTCHDRPPKWTDLLPYEDCTKPCSGDPNQTCGDAENMNIYRAQIQVCKTYAGPKPNVPCVFPFIIDGVRHEKCTKDKSEESIPWCGTETDTTHYNWGYCNEFCPLEEVCRTNGGIEPNSSCVFPFIYKDVTFNHCIREGKITPWCGTEYVTTNTSWGYCDPMYCTFEKEVQHNIVEEEQYITTIIIACSIAGCIGIAGLVGLICQLRYRKLNNMYIESQKNIQIIRKQLEGDNSKINKDLPLKEQTNTISYDKKYDISKKMFTTEKIIGDGQFGAVFIGNFEEMDLDIKVAIKQVKNISDNNQLDSIIDELKIISILDVHMNLVNMIGACITDGIYILLEYCPHRDLKHFLIERKDEFLDQNTSESEYDKKFLLNCSYSIAKGMEYLSSVNIMHGDLAARNILLSENLVAKIGDFGLSKNIYDGREYTKINRRMIPWAWMALEYLTTGKFNMKSDVWSFGIVLWEIFSMGDKPYGSESYENVKDKLLKGYKLPAPENINMLDQPDKFYSEIVIPCWERNSKKRPDFMNLVSKLGNMLGESGILEYRKSEEEYKNSPLVKRINNLEVDSWKEYNMTSRITKKFSSKKKSKPKDLPIMENDVKQSQSYYSEDSKDTKDDPSQDLDTYNVELPNQQRYVDMKKFNTGYIGMPTNMKEEQNIQIIRKEEHVEQTLKLQDNMPVDNYQERSTYITENESGLENNFQHFTINMPKSKENFDIEISKESKPIRNENTDYANV